MKKATVTLVQVAKKAGVSTMTASRAYSGSGYISEEAKTKVLAAGSALGYRPNTAARIMKGGRANVIGVVVNDLSSVVVNAFVTALGIEIRKQEMDMFIYNSYGDLDGEQGERVSQLLADLCDGLLYVLPRMSERYLKSLERSDSPIVLVNYWRRATKLPVILGDNFKCSREAVQHLIAQGHRRIAFVRGTAHTGQSSERERGFREAMKDAGLDVDESLIAQGDFSELSGFEAGRVLCTQAAPPTAIFAANDEMALGCMNAIRAAGREVPKDVSIIGFDDVLAASSVPRLTTLRHPIADIAGAAIEELMRRIENRTGQRQRVEFPSEFIVRESTAPFVKGARGAGTSTGTGTRKARRAA